MHNAEHVTHLFDGCYPTAGEHFSDVSNAAFWASVNLAPSWAEMRSKLVPPDGDDTDEAFCAEAEEFIPMVAQVSCVRVTLATLSPHCSSFVDITIA